VDIFASAFTWMLDSDHFLSLVTPLQLGMKSGDDNVMLMNNSLDLGCIDLPLSDEFDSLDDVLVLEAFSSLVQVLSLSAFTVSVSSDTDWLAWVSFVGGTDLMDVWNNDW
jgi:hypothetical protein